jgi:hypothetical protein
MKKTFLILAILTLAGLCALTPVGRAAAASRYFELHDASTLRLKEGAYNAPWETMYSSSPDHIYFASGTDARLGVLDENMNFYVKDGSKTAPWTLVATDVVLGQVLGDKIFVVTSDLRLLVKQGDIHGGWTLLKDRVYGVVASDNRIAITTDYDGATVNILAKEGGLSAPWVTLANTPATYGYFGMPQLAVTDSRIAFVNSGSTGSAVKDGSLYAPWNTNVWTGIAFYYKLAGSRMCVSGADGSTYSVYCKGATNATWAKVYNAGLLVDASQDKISVIDFDTADSKVLEGTLAQNSGWLTLDRGSLIFFNSVTGLL